NPPDQLIVVQNRQDIVTVLAFRLRGIDFNLVIEIPKLNIANPVPDQIIKGGKQYGAPFEFAALDSFEERKVRGMDVPFALPCSALVVANLDTLNVPGLPQLLDSF